MTARKGCTGLHTYIVHSFIDPIVRSRLDIELVIRRLDCKETIKSTTITNKLRMTKDTYTPLKLPNIVGEIIVIILVLPEMMTQ
jgi:hypothetical protein